jgi:hypothetical protein
VATKPKKPFGRSLSDFGKLLPTEKLLLAACRKGMPAIIGNGTRPDIQSEANTIRPGFLRFLFLGGDEQAPVHEFGVCLNGAWIDGDLDLHGCNCAHPVMLANSKLNGSLGAMGAHLKNLSLEGSSIKALNGDRVVISGSLFLRNQFVATGEVRLSGAQIGGNLECKNGTFEPIEGSEEGYALFCRRARIKGDVLLDGDFKAIGEVHFLGVGIGGDLQCSGGTFAPTKYEALTCDGADIKGDMLLDHGFTATGEVRLLGAQIGGNLSCSEGRYEPIGNDALSFDGALVKGDVLLDESFIAKGTVRLHGARIRGDLSCRNGVFEPKWNYRHALSCNRAAIDGALFLDHSFASKGSVNLTAASVGSLADAPPRIEKGNLTLDGLTYKRIYAGSPTQAKTRIDWLQRQQEFDLGEEFKPQPWEQLIKVLREMGHTSDANAVAMAKQDALREAGKIKGILYPLHWFYGSLAGYGYQPLRTVVAMLVVFLFSGLHYQRAAELGLMGPTSAIIQSNTEIANACGNLANHRETQWTQCGALPQEYTTFSPYWYSADLILPLVDLQQEKDWSPIVMKDDGKTPIWAGAFIRWLMWFEILFGWIASALLVAVLGNLVKKD